DPKRTAAGITAFVVPLDAPGVSVGRPERKLGLRASDTSAIVMDGATIGADAVLGEVGKGFAIAMSGLDGGRIGIAAQSVGIARHPRRRPDPRGQRLHAGLRSRALRAGRPRDDDLRRDERDTAHRYRALAARGMTIQKAGTK